MFKSLTGNLLFQSECYHYLFDAAIKLHQLGLDWSTPSHGPIRHPDGVQCSLRNASVSANAGTLSSNGGIGQSRVDFTLYHAIIWCIHFIIHFNYIILVCCRSALYWTLKELLLRYHLLRMFSFHMLATVWKSIWH